MRRILTILTVPVVVFFTWNPSFAYDIDGIWLLEGGGYASKGVVRVALSDSGYLDILTETEDGNQYLTGYDVRVKLDASRLDINAWAYSKRVDLPVPVGMPELDPTLSQPFRLPSVTVDGMTYQVTLTSTTSGTVKIYGKLDVDVVGTVDIDSESIIWKEGTDRPDIDDKLSGCSAGVPLWALLLLPPLLVKRGRKRRE
ncbi:MAG: hypothetical protein LBT65_10875 [Synergistaceae bacterium]|nr:hypothetical protein [Synergistaceae bacterium]